MNPLIQLKTTSLPLLTVLILACLALSPTAQAVCRDGCDASLADTYQGENALVGDASDSGGNTAFGAYALQDNYLGELNTGIGVEANGLNELGWENTAVGFWALVNNQSTANTAVGYLALQSNTYGYYNTAIGNEALGSNTTASEIPRWGIFPCMKIPPEPTTRQQAPTRSNPTPPPPVTRRWDTAR